MSFGFGRRRKEEQESPRLANASVAYADGMPEESARDHVAVIMDEIETALRTKRQYRNCLARLLKKDQ